MKSFTLATGIFLVLVTGIGLPMASAGPVLSVSGPPVNNPTGIFPTNVLAVQFTLGKAYSDVDIAADLIGNFTGTIFVMNQIGVGTTVANQLATSAFTSAGAPFGTLQTILQGVNFPGAGTYYLIFSTAQSNPPQGLEETNSPVVVADIGASNGPLFFGSGAAYAPNESFSLVNGGGGAYAPEFSLSTPVPEPTAWIPLGVMAVLLIQRRRGK